MNSSFVNSRESAFFFKKELEQGMVTDTQGTGAFFLETWILITKLFRKNFDKLKFKIRIICCLTKFVFAMVHDCET